MGPNKMREKLLAYDFNVQKKNNSDMGLMARLNKLIFHELIMEKNWFIKYFDFSECFYDVFDCFKFSKPDGESVVKKNLKN